MTDKIMEVRKMKRVVYYLVDFFEKENPFTNEDCGVVACILAMQGISKK